MQLMLCYSSIDSAVAEEKNMISKFLCKHSTRVIWIILLFFIMVNSTSKAMAKDVTASSGSATDIQKAIDSVYASGGGTVYIKPGTFPHNGAAIKVKDGVSLMGAGQDKTILTNANIRYRGSNSSPFRVSGLRLSNRSYLEIRSCSNFRVDHITVESASGAAISIQESFSGLIDHCAVRVTGSFYGIVISQGYKQYYPADWKPNANQLLGQSTAIFIEDCDFYGCHHAIVGHGNAHYVARYNSFQNGNSHQIDAHGPGYGPPCGTRLVEVYNNVFNYSPEYTWKAFAIRGGDAVIFNNVIKDYDNGILLCLETRSEGPYPVPMQVRNAWIWDNTFINLGKNNEKRCPGDWEAGSPHCNEVLVWDIADDLKMESKNYIRENREYYLRKPTQEQDGFTYKPYTYPHPLQSVMPKPESDLEAPKNFRLSRINGLLYPK